uniref:C2 domain containing 3 centriole elongation regulator n=1 Tax=Leptobrachium leishanense TaxID=445787 RepID=A0A8C5MB22_9ANUR
MKNQRNKSGRAGSRLHKGSADISPSTSLPPLVEGQVRCFLSVTVSKILWTVPKPPSSALVRLRWWGETTNGTIFRPRESSQTEHKAIKTTARYAVRCGPKQLTSYLTDMGSLVFDINTKLDHLPIGRVQINGISRLTLSHPVRGFFTVVSPTSEKLGELQVSVVLEPLPEAYDSSSSIHNTDVSMDTALSVGKAEWKHESGDTFPPSKLSLQAADRRESETSRASTPRGRDHLYFKENTDPNKVSLSGSNDDFDNFATEEIKTRNQNTATSTVQEKINTPRSMSAPAAQDLLSALLDQGSKLRDAMVVSAMKSDPSVDLDVDLSFSSDLNKDLSMFTHVRAHSDVLNIHKSPSSKDILLPREWSAAPEIDTPSDTKAIELILGSSDLFPDYYWDGKGSPPESIAGSDYYNESELNDPRYDESLLENLFYTAPKSDGSASDDDDPKESQRRKPQKKAGEADVNRASSNESASLGNSRSIPVTSESSLKGSGKSDVIALTVDRLAQLGRMHVARVVVDTLKLCPDNNQVSVSRRSGNGKPPRPAASVKRTFFVEFLFPVSSKSKGDVASASEITRLVSSKIVSGYVKFQQRFVFPVLFSGRMIEHWWKTDLIFRIFLREGTQKKPALIGSSSFPLRDVLLSLNLSVSCDLDVQCTEPQHEYTGFGPLKVSVEVASDSKQLTSSKTTEVAKSTQHSSVNQSLSLTEPEAPTTSNTEPSSPALSVVRVPAAQIDDPPRIVPDGPRVPLIQQQAAEESGLLLHVVLMVQEGKGLTATASDFSAACNPYLNCKLFSSPDASRSAILWGTANPIFNFTQVAPVSLTNQLLTRLKNNVMIIEVWNKASSPGQDKLLGLAKLPLHQFYISFSDSKICRLLLQAQYPVVAVDGFVPVTDVFTGIERGKIKVLLAMGSGDQAIALQRLKHEDGKSEAQLPRPAHFLDPPQAAVQTLRPQEGTTDHVFEVHVENVKGLTPLQSTVWGEADCFVQYYFPTCPSNLTGAELPESGITLKPVRTATTLCMPDPIFNDRQSHSLAAPADTPVQRLLLSAFSIKGLSGGGGMCFEIWCRYYYPNVRDQMVAKGLLPLSRLCAMVTMQHREEVGIQAFSLPLIPVSQNPADRHPQSSGLLNVNVTYRRTVRNAIGMLATRMASVSVQIHRASGLQAAARAVAMHDPSFQYSADVGVNAYITIHPSFLPEAERRITRTVARTFYPEFDHHSEFPCSLVIQRSSGEASSLAEIMNFSEIMFYVFHQSVVSDPASRSQPARDHQLGVVRIPAKELLAKRSGVSGWYPITIEEDSKLTDAPSILQTIVGGMELSIGFSQHSDRERVLEVARGLGWSRIEDAREAIAPRDDEFQVKEDLVTLSITIPKIWLPVPCLLLAGHKHIQRSTHCYLRYKFYDKESVCSSLVRPKLSEDGQQAMVVFEQTRSVELLKHQTLIWYLREERLEIQVWRSYGKDTSGQRPQDTDRLLGCAYVDLGALSENTSRTLTVSGVYPLFKRNVSNLWGAAVRVHLALSSAYHPSVHEKRSSCSDDVSEEEETDDVSREQDEGTPDNSVKCHKETTSPEVPMRGPGSPSTDGNLEKTFAVNVVIERAMHLSLKGSPLTERVVASPSCCVSFPVAGSVSAITSPVIEHTDAPVWDFQHQARLPYELLLDARQALVFKVWHKTDVERVLGFAPVDLSPLLSGFQSVCGWYNIGDFTGQCQGQIKVSITPLESIAHLKEERRARNQANAHAEVTSHGSFLFQPHLVSDTFSSYSIHRPEGLGSAPILKEGIQEPRRSDDMSGLPPLRHEEHMNNVRRFHESLQQAERNSHCAGHLDLLSQSSRSSMLDSLRKNLSELDDIEKYFKQKLYRSLSSRGAQDVPSFQSREAEEKHHDPRPDQEETDTQLLLKKSSVLVSQVSSLITDLQQFPKAARASSSTNGESPNILHLSTDAAELLHCALGKDDGFTYHKHSPLIEGPAHHGSSPSLSPGTSPIPQGELSDLCGAEMNEVTEHEVLSDDHLHGELDEPENECVSDEEFEEGDLIEPRTLNEITTMTDRTSPWSSMLSDSDPEEHPINSDNDGQNHDRKMSEPLSSFHHIEGQRVSGALLEYEEDHIESLINGKTSSDIDEESTFTEIMGLPSPRLQRAGRELVEEPDKNEVKEEAHGFLVPHTYPTNSSTGSSRDSGNIPPDRTGYPEAEHPVTQQSEDVDSDGSSVPSSLCRSTSPSDESATELPNVTSETDVESSHLLSDPLLVPNFFLPPQHLEASMRLLSLSPALPRSVPQEEVRDVLLDAHLMLMGDHQQTIPTSTIGARPTCCSYISHFNGAKSCKVT